MTLTANAPYDLSSPNFPSFYPSNENCQWTIRAPSGLIVYAHFNHLSLEDGVDFLYVGTGEIMFMDTFKKVTTFSTHKLALKVFV